MDRGDSITAQLWQNHQGTDHDLVITQHETRDIIPMVPQERLFIIMCCLLSCKPLLFFANVFATAPSRVCSSVPCKAQMQTTETTLQRPDMHYKRVRGISSSFFSLCKIVIHCS